MGIFSKENIKKAIENPFVFVVLILLIILALGQSFALGCFIGSILAIPVALFGFNPDSLINFFCHGDSWKVKAMNGLSNFLGQHILFIIIVSLVAWWFLNYTDKGKEITSFLD